jgi:hypothetical protein
MGQYLKKENKTAVRGTNFIHKPSTVHTKSGECATNGTQKLNYVPLTVHKQCTTKNTHIN